MRNNKTSRNHTRLRGWEPEKRTLIRFSQIDDGCLCEPSDIDHTTYEGEIWAATFTKGVKRGDSIVTEHINSGEIFVRRIPPTTIVFAYDRIIQ